MREGPWPNKSSRKESNLRGGISRPARKQGADNSMRARGLTVPPEFRSGTYHGHPRARDARCREIKRIQKFKSTTARLLPRFSRGDERGNDGELRRKGGHFLDRVDTILTIYTPVSLHGAAKWKYEKRRVRAVVSRAITERAHHHSLPASAGRLFVRLRIARSISMPIPLTPSRGHYLSTD